MDFTEIANNAIEAGNNEVAVAAIESAGQEAQMVALAKGIIILAMIGSALGEGMLVKSAFQAIGRNPKLEETLFSKVIIAVALVESTAIYALVAFFLM